MINFQSHCTQCAKSYEQDVRVEVKIQSEEITLTQKLCIECYSSLIENLEKLSREKICNLVPIT